MTTPIEYKPVCSGWNYTTLSTLYEADDHLLQAKGVYIRTYRRYFYEDIEGVTWRKSILPVVVLSVFAGLWVFPFAIMLAFRAGAWSLLALIPPLATLLRLGVVLTSGGYCVTRIHTAVQSDVIVAAPTAVKARKVCEVLDRRLAASPEPHASSPSA